MKETNKNYYVGLDMGTNSVGWAVTDEQYNLIRMKGKDYWGVREFDEAQTSAERRSHRISRRRRQREIVRIGLLKDFFHETIINEDDKFFIRLDNSRYFEEDKDESLKSDKSIFDDDDYSDKDYYRQFPTVFHLRKALIEDTINDEKRYARFLYLALLNMFKHRGHFLGGEIGKGGIVAIDSTYALFAEKIEELIPNASFPVDGAQKIESILADRSISRSERATRIFEQLEFTKDRKVENIIVRGICGLKIDATKIFEGLDDSCKIDICFSDSNYEDKATEISDVIGEDNYELVVLMKQIYDAGMLSSILHGYSFLSMARVDAYNKHREDLKILKKVYRTELSVEKYDAMFREIQAGNYSAYVNSTNSSGVLKDGNGLIRRSLVGKGRSREDLYKTIKSDLKNLSGDEVEYILQEIDKETFLPKQLTADNGVIPNQLHKMEMEKILKNAEKRLPFLTSKDETGYSISQKIVSLFSFHMPYYIGPVSENSKTGWVVRKSDGQVFPWNLSERINIDITREKFIERLIRKCTYLSGERVMPKNSLLYEKYCVLNEINNIKIDGVKIPVELKKDIYNDKFKTGKRLTKKSIAKYLHDRGVLDDETQLTGIDINVNSSLSSYGKFYAIFGEDLEKDSVKKNVEKIIYYSTIYGDSKKDLKELLEKEFNQLLDEASIKRILGFKFKDWGRMSKAMLELQGCDKETGEIKTIINALWDTNYNLMELINGEEFTFKEALEEKQVRLQKSLLEFKHDDLDDYYFSAPVKRMVWQTVELLKAITREMGCAPSRVFIEMTRGEGEKGKRTESRGKQLVELYKNIKDEGRNWISEINNADIDGRLRSKKLYLYYTQLGRCMYTGEPIDLEELFDSNKYDIDHIYPRHYVKDDNINNNLVLVNKAKNARKSDNYPLDKMSDSVYGLWRILHEKKLINDEKYRRLTGRNPFTDEQKAGFIARQLVETSQGTKGVADLIKQLFAENTVVVYAKASNVSDFRRDNDFLKSRTINDFHHAKDAYLNIVVGNVYYTKFTQNPINYIRNEYSKDAKKYRYNLGGMFDFNVERGGYVAWVAARDGEKYPTLKTVKKIMSKNTPLITRWVYEAKGAIANETLYPAKMAKEDNYIPFKQSDEKLLDVTKYGGFNSVSGAYFFLVEHDDKKKRIRTIETVPVYLKATIEQSKDGLINYCIENLGLINPRICICKIKIQSLLEINGYRCRISGRGDNRLLLKNEVSLSLNNEWNNYIHYLEKAIKEQKMNDNISSKLNIDLMKQLIEKHKSSLYANRPVCICDKLDSIYEKFLELDSMKQVEALINFLQLSRIGGHLTSLKVLGEADTFGKLRINKNISKLDTVYLINQSITGVYESKIDLLKV
ncbi:MAG: type II CRISPR RNA-guided endonuclease Cas9 [Pseudobutyrivibrio sp.]|nr:type II CRISPR RNA-guided endonuclease Cas9 [Pseudobutyrivibrio sp.]